MGVTLATCPAVIRRSRNGAEESTCKSLVPIHFAVILNYDCLLVTANTSYSKMLFSWRCLMSRFYYSLHVQRKSERWDSNFSARVPTVQSFGENLTWTWWFLWGYVFVRIYCKCAVFSPPKTVRNESSKVLGASRETFNRYIEKGVTDQPCAKKPNVSWKFFSSLTKTLPKRLA